MNTVIKYMQTEVTIVGWVVIGWILGTVVTAVAIKSTCNK